LPFKSRQYHVLLPKFQLRDFRVQPVPQVLSALRVQLAFRESRANLGLRDFRVQLVLTVLMEITV
jgi:hypothetical protein